MSTNSDVRQDVKMYLASDWNLKEETAEYYLLERTKTTGSGHLWVALFTGWWTFGIGNLIYHFKNKEKKKILK